MNLSYDRNGSVAHNFGDEELKTKVEDLISALIKSADKKIDNEPLRIRAFAADKTLYEAQAVLANIVPGVFGRFAIHYVLRNKEALEAVKDLARQENMRRIAANGRA